VAAMVSWCSKTNIIRSISWRWTGVLSVTVKYRFRCSIQWLWRDRRRYIFYQSYTDAKGQSQSFRHLGGGESLPG
jgi:hypothetical protein